MKGYRHTWIVALNSALLQTMHSFSHIRQEDDEMTVDEKKMLRKLKNDNIKSKYLKLNNNLLHLT